jgi:hypothetical protein
MKFLPTIRLMFIVAIALGISIAWSVATPNILSGKNMIGGTQNVFGCACNDAPYDGDGCEEITKDGEDAHCYGGIYECSLFSGSSKTCQKRSSTETCSGGSYCQSWRDAKCE